MVGMGARRARGAEHLQHLTPSIAAALADASVRHGADSGARCYSVLFVRITQLARLARAFCLPFPG